MDDNNESSMERDAVGTVVAKTNEVAVIENEIEALEPYNNNGYDQSMTNNYNTNVMLSRVSNNASTITLNGCKEILIGNSTNVMVGWSPGNFNAVAEQKPNSALTKLHDDESVYRKTPTIKKMMESNEAIENTFLDYVCRNLGFRWREMTVQLRINQLFVDQMYIDNFDKGGIKEVNSRSNVT
jgi:hypothetical protein